MDDLNMYAITRWVSRENSEPKMGVLAPCRFEKVDCFLWVQVLRLLLFTLSVSLKLVRGARCLLPTMSGSTRSRIS